MEIEALAIAKAFQCASEIGINQIVLEWDSQMVMKAFINESKSLTPMVCWLKMWCFVLVLLLNYATLM